MNIFRNPLFVIKSKRPRLMEKLEERILFDAVVELPTQVPATEVSLMEPAHLAESVTGETTDNLSSGGVKEELKIGLLLVDMNHEDYPSFVKSVHDANPDLNFQVLDISGITSKHELLTVLDSTLVGELDDKVEGVWLYPSHELAGNLIATSDLNLPTDIENSELVASLLSPESPAPFAIKIDNAINGIDCYVGLPGSLGDQSDAILKGQTTRFQHAVTRDGDSHTLPLEQTRAGREIVVIDKQLRNYESLLTTLSSREEIDVVLIDSNVDGIEVLAEYVREMSNIQAIHILSHGSQGTIELGSTVLDLASMSGIYFDALVTIGNAMSVDGDILLYACDLTSTEEGIATAKLFAHLTGADVAASEDATGYEAFGGNWILESTYGLINTPTLQLTTWQSLLAPPVVVVPGEQETLEDTPIILADAIAITVASNEVTSLIVTLEADHGVIHLASLDGLTFLDETSDGVGLIKLQGTIIDINNALNGLRITPTENYFGSMDLTVVADDGSSITERSVAVTVISQNDAPVLVVNPINVDQTGSPAEGGSHTFTIDDFHSNDPDNNDQQLVYVLNSLPTAGHLTLNGHAVAVGTIFTQTQLKRGELTYHHDGSETFGDGFSVSVNDGSGGHFGPVNIDIHVTPVNDPMTVTANAVVYEGGSTSDPSPGPGKPLPGLQLSLTDVESDQKFITIKSLPEGGILKFNGVEISQSDIDDGLTFSVDQWGLLEYIHDGEDDLGGRPSNRQFTVEVYDEGGGENAIQRVTVNVNINVISVNDDLVLVHHDDTEHFIPDGQTYILGVHDMEVYDPDGPSESVTYTLENTPINGLLLINGSPVAAGATFTQAQLRAGLVTFQHDEKNGGLETLEFTVRDSTIGIVSDELGVLREGGAGSPPRILELNFALEVIVDPGQVMFLEVLEGETIITSEFEPGDIIVFDELPTRGVFRINGTEIQAGQNYTISQGDVVSYTHDGSHVGHDEFYVSINGEDHFGNVRVYLVNDPPNFEVIKRLDEVYEGRRHPITTAHLQATDEETSNPTELIYTIVDYPRNGVIYLDGRQIPNYSTFTHQDVIDGLVSYEHDGGELFLDAVLLSLSDGSRTVTRTLEIQAIPVNDRPVIRASEIQLLEGETKHFSTATFNVGDPDGIGTDLNFPPDAPVQVRIDSLPGTGVLLYNDPLLGLIPVTIGFTFDRENVDRLQYQHNGEEVVADSFNFTVLDNHTRTTPFDDLGSTPGIIRIDIIPVNDAPEVNVNTGLIHDAESDRRVYEGGIRTITTDILNSVDPDSSDEQIQYRIINAPAHGTLLLNGSAIGSGSSFTQEQLQSGALRYRHNGSETIADQFVFQVDDSASNVAPTTVQIGGIPINDAPAISAPSRTVVNTGTFSFTGSNQISISDVDAASGEVRVTLSVNDTAGLLQILPGSTTVTGNGSTAITVIGGLSEVNAALATLTYSTIDHNAEFTLSIVVNDFGNTGVDPSAVPPGEVPNLQNTGDSVSEEASRSVRLLVSTVNDRPEIAGPDIQNVLEDRPLVFSDANSNSILISDLDHFGSMLEVSINVTQGRFSIANAALNVLSGSITNSTSATVRGTLDELNNALNGLTFLGNSNFNGMGTLALQVNDLGNTGDGGASIANKTVSILVTPINDAPVVTAPGQVLVADGVTLIPGFSINDVDYNDGGNPATTVGEDDFMQVTVRLTNTAGTPLTALEHENVRFSSSAVGHGAIVDSNYDGVNSALVIRGSLAQVNNYLSGLTVELFGSLVNINEVYRVEVVADDRLRDEDGALNDEGTANGGLNISSSGQAIEVPNTVIDPYAIVPGTLNQNVSRSSVRVISTTVNEAPSFSNLVSELTFTEGVGINIGTAIAVAGSASIFDPELSALNNWSGSQINIARQGGANDQDIFSLATVNGVTVVGLTVLVNNVDIGQFSYSNGNLKIDFNGTTVTIQQVNAVLQAIRYQNNSHVPPDNVVLQITVNDGDTDPDRVNNPQGSGGNQSATELVTVTIIPVNDAPTLTNLATRPYIEDGQPVVLAPSANIFDHELVTFQGGEGDWGHSTLTLQRNGTANSMDRFHASGSLSNLTEGSTLLYGSEVVGTVLANSNGILRIEFSEGTTTEEVRNVIRSIAYSNPIQTLSGGQTQNVSLHWILNDGDLDNPERVNNPQGQTGAKQASVNQTVRLTGVNDAPLGRDFERTINQNGSYTFSVADFGFTDPVDEPDNAFVNVVISTLPALGTVTLNGVPVAAGQVVLVTDIQAGRLVWTPPSNEGGPNFTSLTFQVQDNGGTANGGVNLDPVPKTALFHVNRPPLLSAALENQSNLDSDVVSLPLGSHFTDPEGHTFTFSATGLPPGLSINATTGVISGTLHSSASVPGDYTVSIRLTDELGAESTFSFDWEVINTVPVATDDLRTVDENAIATGNVITNDSDADGDALAVSAVNGLNSNVGQSVAGSNGGAFIIHSDGTYTFQQGSDFDDLALNETRTTSVEYTLRDADGATATAQVIITVRGLNDAPVSTAIPSRTNADGESVSVSFAGYFNDVDNGETLTFSTSSSLPAGLTLDASTGIISGNIDRSASVGASGGQYVINLVATDSHNATTSQTFIWTITNPVPIAVDDSGTTSQESIFTGNVLTNDSDPDGDPLSVISVDGQASNVAATVAGTNGGVFTIQADGSYSFNPANDFDYLPLDGEASTSVEYTISDGQGGTATAIITIKVIGTNDAPTSETINNRVDADFDIINWDISTYFTDVDQGDTLTFTVVGTLPPGLTLDSNTGVISGQIDDDASLVGSYPIQIIATDGHLTTSQSFNWRVTNPAPTAIDDDIETDELSVLDHNVIDSNDFDTDGDALKVIAVNGETTNVGTSIPGSNGGSFTIDEDGNLTFDPLDDFIYLAQGESQTTTITYTISDEQGGESTATVTVTVIGVNTEPTSNPLPDLRDVDSATVSIDISGYFSDPDSTDRLEFSATGSLPPGLSINPNTGVISGVIASDASVSGPYSVTITATDNHGISTQQVFTWHVDNPPPIARDDEHFTTENSDLTGSVFDNDEDPDHDAIVVIEVNGDTTNVGISVVGSHGGAFTIRDDGSYDFNPEDDFNDLAAGESRSTSVEYRISDGQGGYSTATLTVTVNGVNDVPVSNPIATQSSVDSETVRLDVSSHFVDPDTSDSLTFSDNGTLPPGLSIDPITGVISGTLDSSASTNGPYLVEITVTDSSGATITETIVWNVANPGPTAVDDQFEVVGSDDSEVIGNAINNDSDPDNDVLSVVPVTNVPGSNGGIFTILSDGTIIFDPNGEFDHIHVTDSLVTQIQYELVDADGATSIATIAVTVIGINNSPVAVDDYYELSTNVVSGNVYDNDSEPDGHQFTGEVTVAPIHGTVRWNGDGSFSYTPGPTFIGSDQFTYTITDQYGATSSAVVHITRPFAWDSFRNESIPPTYPWIQGNYAMTEQLASYQLHELASNPILAGYATPGSVLKGKIYDVSTGFVSEVTTTSNAAGNWVMNFHSPKRLHNPIVIIEQVATEEVLLGNPHHFRLTESTYRSLQLGVEHRNELNIGSILSDRPSLILQKMHQQNLYPLALK